MTPALANSPAAWSDRAAAACPREAVGWTAQGQADRFAAVLAALSPRPGETILDYGSGTGALSEHIAAGVGYIGFDWAEGMVERARRDHPGVLFTHIQPSRADLVAVVGTFNLRGNWSKQATFHTLRHLWDTTGCRSLAASLYAGTDERCLIYTEAELERCGRDLGYGSVVERHRHNDLLLVARR